MTSGNGVGALVTWSEFQHVSSLLSNINFFPNCFTSRFSTELTLKHKRHSATDEANVSASVGRAQVPPTGRHIFPTTRAMDQTTRLQRHMIVFNRNQLTCHSPTLNLAANQRGRHDLYLFI